MQTIMTGLINKFSKRLIKLESIGFIQKKGCITNGVYSFLYHQIDTSEMGDKEFEEFVNIITNTI